MSVDCCGNLRDSNVGLRDRWLLSRNDEECTTGVRSEPERAVFEAQSVLRRSFYVQEITTPPDPITFLLKKRVNSPAAESRSCLCVFL